LKEKLATLEETLHRRKRSGYSFFIGGVLIVVGALILGLAYRDGM
jgi:hypothetical protein